MRRREAHTQTALGIVSYCILPFKPATVLLSGPQVLRIFESTAEGVVLPWYHL
jgi:hypothetical protein